jgi:CheY-like chemotaxis protein
MASERLNFSGVRALIVDGDPHAARILSQILRGFGLSQQVVADSGEEAQRHLKQASFDLVICEVVHPDMQAVDLLRWIRRQAEGIKFVPIIVLTGYSDIGNVTSARDSGASLVVKKPVSPAVLLDHITWAARTPRPFVETSSYIGPDRRFKNDGPPGGGEGRRESDLPADVGAATEPNMSQHEIDSLLKPNKVVVA